MDLPGRKCLQSAFPSSQLLCKLGLSRDRRLKTGSFSTFSLAAEGYKAHSHKVFILRALHLEPCVQAFSCGAEDLMMAAGRCQLKTVQWAAQSVVGDAKVPWVFMAAEVLFAVLRIGAFMVLSDRPE